MTAPAGGGQEPLQEHGGRDPCRALAAAALACGGLRVRGGQGPGVELSVDPVEPVDGDGVRHERCHGMVSVQ